MVCRVLFVTFLLTSLAKGNGPDGCDNALVHQANTGVLVTQNVPTEDVTNFMALLAEARQDAIEDADFCRVVEALSALGAQVFQSNANQAGPLGEYIARQRRDTEHLAQSARHLQYRALPLPRWKKILRSTVMPWEAVEWAWETYRGQRGETTGRRVRDLAGDFRNMLASSDHHGTQLASVLDGWRAEVDRLNALYLQLRQLKGKVASLKILPGHVARNYEGLVGSAQERLAILTTAIAALEPLAVLSQQTHTTTARVFGNVTLGVETAEVVSNFAAQITAELEMQKALSDVYVATVQGAKADIDALMAKVSQLGKAHSLPPDVLRQLFTSVQKLHATLAVIHFGSEKDNTAEKQIAEYEALVQESLRLLRIDSPPPTARSLPAAKPQDGERKE